MTTFFSAARSFWNDEQGVTAIEYGLIASLIGVAAIAAMTSLGTKLAGTFTYITGLLH